MGPPSPLDPLPPDVEADAAYVHVPFCRHRCGYCNFTLVAGRDDLIARYLAALERELAIYGRPRPVATLYLGGGTPTHLPPRELAELLRLVTTWFVPRPGAEFTVEANPSDLDEDRVAVLADHGVTRVSLGAQSFRTDTLRTLERDHDATVIAAAVERLRRYPSITDVSLDLIFGVPGTTEADWRADLAAALALAPEHLSTYGLTIERGTSFFSRQQHGRLTLPGEDVEAAMYEMTIDTLAAAGYEHYEVSSFARPGHASRHNSVYWSGRPWYAVGPGATRYLGHVRSSNHRSVTTWLARIEGGRSPVAESEALTPDDRVREGFVFGMRRRAGVSLGELSERTGLDAARLLGGPIRELIAAGLFETDDGSAVGPLDRVRLSRRGLLVSDAIWPRFLSP